MWTLFPALLMGWALGANDAANVFGLAVSVRAVRYLTAVVLTAFGAVAGAYLAGSPGMATYSALAHQSLGSSFCAVLAAGFTVAVMTWRGLPVSTTQAIVGGILGVSLAAGRSVDWSVLGRIGISWVSSPLGSLLLAFVLHRLLSPLVERRLGGLIWYDRLTRWGLIVIGLWGAYALGANNVANVTGVYVGVGLLSVPAAALVGGGSIALGVLTYARPVMITVGEKLVALGTWPALVALTAQAAALQVFAALGVPVSSSHAVVGAVVGIGLVKGVAGVNLRQLGRIVVGWVLTPTAAGLVAAAFWMALGRFLPS